MCLTLNRLRANPPAAVTRSKVNATWQTTSPCRSRVCLKPEESAPDCSFSVETSSTRVARSDGATPNKTPDTRARAQVNASTEGLKALERPSALPFSAAKRTRDELVQAAI